MARHPLLPLVGTRLASVLGVFVVRGGRADSPPTPALSAPVLIVGAGILPTQWLWPLDRFDEWMQRGVVSCGVRTFRLIARRDLLVGEDIATVRARAREALCTAQQREGQVAGVATEER